MYSKKTAEVIKAKVEKLGVFCYKKEEKYLSSEAIEYYYYGSIEDRNKHIEEQKAKGYCFDEDQRLSIDLYNDLFKGTYIDVYHAYFIKDLEPLKW